MGRNASYILQINKKVMYRPAMDYPINPEILGYCLGYVGPKERGNAMERVLEACSLP